MLVTNELDIAYANSGIYLKVHASVYNDKFNLDQSKYMRIVVIEKVVFIIIAINDVTSQFIGWNRKKDIEILIDLINVYRQNRMIDKYVKEFGMINMLKVCAILGDFNKVIYFVNEITETGDNIIWKEHVGIYTRLLQRCATVNKCTISFTSHSYTSQHQFYIQNVKYTVRCIKTLQVSEYLILTMLTNSVNIYIHTLYVFIEKICKEYLPIGDAEYVR